MPPSAPELRDAAHTHRITLLNKQPDLWFHFLNDVHQLLVALQHPIGHHKHFGTYSGGEGKRITSMWEQMHQKIRLKVHLSIMSPTKASSGH